MKTEMYIFIVEVFRKSYSDTLFYHFIKGLLNLFVKEKINAHIMIHHNQSFDALDNKIRIFCALPVKKLLLPN